MENPDFKYAHYVSYTYAGGYGASEILSDVKQYETRTQVADLAALIRANNNLEGVPIIITNILTVKNI